MSHATEEASTQRGLGMQGRSSFSNLVPKQQNPKVLYDTEVVKWQNKVCDPVYDFQPEDMFLVLGVPCKEQIMEECT